MSIHIRSITIGKQITIAYLAENGDAHTLKSNDEPLEAFYTALGQLVGDLCHLCGLEAGCWANSRVTAIVLKVPELESKSSAKFTLVGRPVDDMPEVKIPTNFIQPSILGAEFADLLAGVLEEAKRFVNGDRAKKQLSLVPDAREAA